MEYRDVKQMSCEPRPHRTDAGLNKWLMGRAPHIRGSSILWLGTQSSALIFLTIWYQNALTHLYGSKLPHIVRISINSLASVYHRQSPHPTKKCTMKSIQI